MLQVRLEAELSKQAEECQYRPFKANPLPLSIYMKRSVQALTIVTSDQERKSLPSTDE